MRIGGLLKSSLIEYPGLISAVIFTQGCNFRCPYCHNPQLVDPAKFTLPVSQEEILAFLEMRRGMLDAVVITGGEPTIHDDLPFLLTKIKNYGYPIKLDTNGTNPEMIELLLKMKLVNYLAMDIKAPLDKYFDITRVPCEPEKIKESIRLINNSAIDFEFRTTVIDTLHSEDDIFKIRELIPQTKKFYLQKFEPKKTLDAEYLKKRTLSTGDFKRLKERFEQHSLNCAVR